MIKFGFIKHCTKGQQVLMVLSQSHQAATWCLFTVCCLLLISPAGINTRPLSASIYLFTNLFFPILVCPSLPLPSVWQSLKRKGRPSRGSGRPGRRKLAGGRRRKRRRRGGRSTMLRWRRRRPRSSRGRRTRRRRGGTDRQQQVGAKHLPSASAGGVTGTFTFKS